LHVGDDEAAAVFAANDQHAFVERALAYHFGVAGRRSAFDGGLAEEGRDGVFGAGEGADVARAARRVGLVDHQRAHRDVTVLAHVFQAHLDTLRSILGTRRQVDLDGLRRVFLL